MIRRVGCALLGFSLVAFCTAAKAQPPEPAMRSGGTMQPTGPFLMPGVNLALAFDRAEEAEFSFGGELSSVTVRDDLLWAGAYLDATYSTGSDETRLSIGPELGFSFIGVDAAYLLKLGGEHGTQHGFSLRPMLTVGVVALFFRSAWLFGSNADWSGEIGALIKLPIEL